MHRSLKEADLVRYFPPRRGWEVIERKADNFDIRNTMLGVPIKCIDKDNGNTENGYNPNTVPLSPAWPGAVDGIIPYMDGSTPDEKVEEASRRTRSAGHEPANHGDYISGPDGCKFRQALVNGKFQSLIRSVFDESQNQVFSNEEYLVLTTKLGVHYTTLRRPSEVTEPDGFVLNDIDGSNILPEGGRYYPIETWLGRKVGIPYEVALPMIEKTGQLLLPKGRRRLFVAR